MTPIAAKTFAPPPAVPMTPAQYVVWVSATCLSMLERAPDEVLVIHDRNLLAVNIEQVAALMTREPPINELSHARATERLEECIWVFDRRLETGVAVPWQQDFARYLFAIQTALAKVSCTNPQPLAVFALDGYHDDSVREWVPSNRPDYSNRVGDAIARCYSCQARAHALRYHVPWLEVLLADCSGGRPISTPLINHIQFDLQFVVNMLSRVPAADLLESDFSQALVFARRAYATLVTLRQLDPNYPISDCRGEFEILIENIHEAKANPTAGRLS